MFLDWKNQYCENDYTTQSHTAIDSVQSLSQFQWHFLQKKKNNPKTHMEPQNTPNWQSKLEKEKSWNHHMFLFQIILQRYS